MHDEERQAYASREDERLGIVVERQLHAGAYSHAQCSSVRAPHEASDSL